MFKLNGKIEKNENIMKCDYIRYSPAGISTTITDNSQTFIKLPREDSVISLINRYLDKFFDILHPATGNRYADGFD